MDRRRWRRRRRDDAQVRQDGAGRYRGRRRRHGVRGDRQTARVIRAHVLVRDPLRAVRAAAAAGPVAVVLSDQATGVQRSHVRLYVRTPAPAGRSVVTEDPRRSCLLVLQPKRRGGRWPGKQIIYYHTPISTPWTRHGFRTELFNRKSRIDSMCVCVCVFPTIPSKLEDRLGRREHAVFNGLLLFCMSRTRIRTR